MLMSNAIVALCVCFCSWMSVRNCNIVIVTIFRRRVCACDFITFDDKMMSEFWGIFLRHNCSPFLFFTTWRPKWIIVIDPNDLPGYQVTSSSSPNTWTWTHGLHGVWCSCCLFMKKAWRRLIQSREQAINHDHRETRITWAWTSSRWRTASDPFINIWVTVLIKHHDQQIEDWCTITGDQETREDGRRKRLHLSFCKEGRRFCCQADQSAQQRQMLNLMIRASPPVCLCVGVCSPRKRQRDLTCKAESSIAADSRCIPLCLPYVAMMIP